MNGGWGAHGDRLRVMARRPDAFELAAHLVMLVHDVDPAEVAQFWAHLTDEERQAVMVVLACQVDPDVVTTNGLRERVDAVAGVGADG